MATETSRAAVFLFSVLCCISGTECVSCDFQTGMCGWQNQNSSAGQWNRGVCDKGWCAFGNYIMTLNMDKTNVNDTGLLLSPILNESADETRLFRFDYYIDGEDACKLSVLLLEAQSLTLLWNTTTGTTGNNFLISPNISLPCGRDQYQIILEGKKTSEKQCKISIDNIVYTKDGTTTCLTRTSSTTAKTLSPVNTSTTTKTTTTTAQSTTSDDTPGSESAGVIIITVIIVTAIIFFVVVVCVYLLRRRAVAKGRTAHWTVRLFSRGQSKPVSRDNKGYCPDDQELRGVSGSTHENNTHKDHTYKGSISPSYARDNPPERPSASGTESTKLALGENKTAFETSPHDNYNHLGKQHDNAPSDLCSGEHPVYAIPHAQRKMASASEPDVYNRLGEKQASNMSKEFENHYDHFNNEMEEYNTTSTEDKARDQQRELAADQYSHI